MSCRRFAAKSIGQYLKNILRYAPQVRAGRGGEALHQLRVNLRRLRNMLWIFRDLFPAGKLSAWKKAFRAVGKVSSPLRDLDVYSDYLIKYRRRSRSPAARTVLDGLVRDARGRRREFSARTAQALDECAREGVFRDAARSLEVLSTSGTAGGGAGRDSPAEIYKICRKKIFKRVRDLLAFDAVARQPANVEGLHRMRIAAKHLRYSLEGLKEIYGPPIDPYIERVTGFHRYLGAIHDHDVWIAHIAQFAGRKGTAARDQLVLSELQKYSRLSRNKVYKEFAAAWFESRREKFFEGLMEYVHSF
ncbi:MAG: CHAD domain-containing protein [Candidatus Omnitrophica bacterium]|nr:CHAD domain-containing protein [Candidatus Omnitrophota bacterium]